MNRVYVKSGDRRRYTEEQKPTPTYRSWLAMRSRCTNPARQKYETYGAKGITVCERWSSFDNFFADMGERPVGTSIDRIDNSKGYEPNNCRWATAKEQRLNSSRVRWLEFQGEMKCIKDWSRHFGVSYETAIHRIKGGMTFEQVFLGKTS